MPTSASARTYLKRTGPVNGPVKPLPGTCPEVAASAKANLDKLT